MSAAVTVKNLSKRFVVDLVPPTMFNLFKRVVRHREYSRELWALRDLDFEIDTGDRIGIIGDNGSGKTTLLRIIAGLYRPTSGTIRVSGEPAAFLQMGIGMERDLSALENIFLFGAVMGVPKRRIRRQLDEIIRFAEIQDYIYFPLRDFSSGMIQRVAFAIARLVTTDILLLDEMLATGDIGFRKKCYHVLEEYVRGAKTIIITSHETEMIRLFCNKCLWLEKGGQRLFGPTDRVLPEYIQSKNVL